MDMKLLIVDDNSEMRDLIKQALSGIGAEFAECEDGDEVVAAYAAHGFTSEDRVLMDLQMPRVSGLEATRRIRAAFPDAQIIIVTQFNDAHWRAAAAQAGACGYVLKENLLELRLTLQASP